MAYPTPAASSRVEPLKVLLERVPTLASAKNPRGRLYPNPAATALDSGVSEPSPITWTGPAAYGARPRQVCAAGGCAKEMTARAAMSGRRMRSPLDLRRPDDPSRSGRLRSGLLALRPRLAAGFSFFWGPRPPGGGGAKNKIVNKEPQKEEKTKRERRGRPRSYHTCGDRLVATASRV